MRAAATQVRAIADEYTQAAATLLAGTRGATDSWRGATKDKFIQFVEGPSNDYLARDIPQLVLFIAELLENNARAMEETDVQVASQIPSTL